MRFTTVTLTSGVLFFFVSAVSAKTFNIEALRFPEDSCNGQPIGERTHVKGNGKCHSWDDGIAFKSFDYGWAKHRPAESNPEKYGACTISLWLEKGCYGESMADAEHANEERWLGSCVSWLDPPPEKAKSMKITCRK
ncbi:hypothetical protein Tdes44962_MAKER07032 [Teratosphaeria destructans]|uniref:Uncharacterized protein n=1 Tax=Teratosphaeria destructans TaxID=418781 RepID=A0A9W7W6I0_9PEZI|nr:hypothetical protein Tdes44962_MAKER07032 [Teratosphaeria destructans]